MSDRDERRGIGRRALIRWSVATGAALGLPLWKVFEVLEGSGGKALAADATCATTNRSVHIVAGNGGFAWFQLLWPHNDVAAAGNAMFAFHAPGMQTMATGTDRPLTLGPEAPWKTLDGKRQVTAMMAGSNETHTDAPSSSSTIMAGTTLFAACAALQQSQPTLVPVIAIDNVPYGSAPGAPRVARVGSAEAIVGLFDSVASRMGGVLSTTSDADLFETSYKAFLSLQAAANVPTSTRPFSTAKTSARLLGKNLAAALAPSAADLARYGVDAASPTKLLELAKALVIASKAFTLGLTSSVVVPAMRDDPHGAFNDMMNLRATVGTLGKILDAFLADLMAVDDPTCGGHKIGENVVISIHGDTPKTPLDRGGWPDGTPGQSNWVYVMGAGYLKSGWFGGIRRDGTARGWDPATGSENAMDAGTTAASAAAAVTFAVAKGDMRRVDDVARGIEIGGVARPQTM